MRLGHRASCSSLLEKRHPGYPRGHGSSRHPRAYQSDAVARVFPEESPLHLVAVAVRVEDLSVVETGAGPQDGLAVQLQGAHPVLLLDATAEQLPTRAEWHVGEP